MREISSIAELPMNPAVYAIYGGKYEPQKQKYAYVGVGEKLRNRVRNHLVLQDSSVTTTAAVVGLRVEHVRGVVWWEHPKFLLPEPKNNRRDDRPALEAAERIAEEVLRPTLRSRGTPSKGADEYLADPVFRSAMEALFNRDTTEPTGNLKLPTLPELIDKVKTLEKRIDTLEGMLRHQGLSSVRTRSAESGRQAAPGVAR